MTCNAARREARMNALLTGMPQAVYTSDQNDGHPLLFDSTGLGFAIDLDRPIVAVFIGEQEYRPIVAKRRIVTEKMK